MKLPMKFRILHMMSQVPTLSDYQVMEGLRADYGNEGQFKISIIKFHLASMKAVGMIENVSVILKEYDELSETFRITDYGREKLKYLPKFCK